MGKTASARKGKDPHLRFRIAFEEVEGRELKEDKWKRLTNNVLVFTCRKYFPFHFFSFLFISFFERKKKRNGLLVVTRTLSSTERQKKTSNEVVSLRISLLPFIIIIIFSTSVSLVPSP